MKKLPTFRPATLLKRDPNTVVSLCFPVFLMIILTFMNIWFETSASGGFLIFSIVDCYMDLKVEGLFSLSKGWFHDGVRLQIRVTDLVLVFKSASLVLKRVPTCIQKHKINTFGKLIKFLHWLFLVVLDGFRSL